MGPVVVRISIAVPERLTALAVRLVVTAVTRLLTAAPGARAVSGIAR